MSEKLNILHVISNLHVGGAEKMLVTAANLFVDKGHDVGVALLVDGGPLCSHLNPRVKLHSLSRKGRFDLRAMRKLSMLANSYQIVHIHLKHNLKFVFVANLIWRIRNPLILHDHSAEVLISGVQKTHLPFFVQYWLRKQTYVGVSEALTNWALRNFRLDPDKCFTLPNAIECKNGSTIKVPISKDVVNIILVSNFRRLKNIEFAITLVEQLTKLGLNLRLDILGQVLDKSYFEEIKALIASLNISDIVTINNDVSDVTHELGNYSFAIHTSKAETGPLVLLEYFHAGLPFLASNHGEVANQVFQKIPELII
ncbi:MAG: glycosyltransferase, partial [Cyclobacteriaceae bacterium]|nr:glycosyltransferase [Cyclobacteriaceae bacterium]